MKIKTVSMKDQMQNHISEEFDDHDYLINNLNISWKIATS